MFGYVWCGTCFFFSSCVNSALVMIGGSSWFLAFWRVNNQPKPWNLQIDWNSLFYATSTLLWGDPSSTSCQHAEHIRQLGLWTAFTCCSKCLVGLGLAKQTRRTGTDVQQQKRSEGRWHSFLSIAIYQPCIHLLLFGAVPFGRRVVVAQKGCLDSRFALIRQQQPQAGNALVIFFQFEDLKMCVSPQFEISWPVWSQKNRGYLDIILLCERSQAWFGSKIRSLFLPCMLNCSFNWLQQHEHCSWAFFRPSGKWLWFVPMFHFHYVPGVDHVQKKQRLILHECTVYIYIYVYMI